MGQPALETLARFRILIAIAWWCGFLGVPAWVALAVIARRGRKSRSRELRWIVEETTCPT